MKMPFKTNKDPKRDLPIDIQEITDLLDEGTIYEDMYLSNKTFVNALISSTKGVFVFVAFDDKDALDLLLQATEIKQRFPVSTDGLFIFFLSEGKSFVTEKDLKSLLFIEDIVDSFKILIENLSKSSSYYTGRKKRSLDELLTRHEEEESAETESLNGMTYEHEGITYEIKDDYRTNISKDKGGFKPLIDQNTLEALNSICIKLIGNTYPDASYRVDSEGNEYVLKESELSIKGLSTGIAGGKKWFRLSDKDPLRAYACTLFGGWFGLHRLMNGCIAEFLFYLLTCGCCGVFYFLDLIQWIFGTASYNEVNYYEKEDVETGITKLTRVKEKIFYKKLPNTLIAVGGLVISVGIFLLVFNLIYKNAYIGLSDLMSHSARNMTPDQAQSMVNSMPDIGIISDFSEELSNMAR